MINGTSINSEYNTTDNFNTGENAASNLIKLAHQTALERCNEDRGAQGNKKP